MSRRSVIAGLVLILLIVMGLRFRQTLLYPFRSQAQEGPSNVGPHAAFFDSGGNIQVAGMVKSKTPANLPITLMIGITAPVSEISSIVSAGSGLRIMLRVTGVEVGTTTSQASNIAQQLNGAGLPPGTLVVFGNELNNLDKEWKSVTDAQIASIVAGCGGNQDCIKAATRPLIATEALKYGNLFREFQSASSGWTAVPAPPDMYNGYYDWQTFVQAAGVYGGTLVANVYDIDLTLWQQLPGTVVAFTEYGPAPSKSLQEHLDFFLNNPVPAGIQMATTLIPDKCDPAYNLETNPDLYLYYVQGQLYDKDGLLVDPNAVGSENCKSGEASEESNYHRFVYPFYSNDVNVMLEQLTEDYDVSCVPKSTYTAGVGGDVNKLIDFLNPLIIPDCQDGLAPDGNACYFEPSGSLEITTAGASRIFGVLRAENLVKTRFNTDVQDPTRRSFTNRFESVEQWWGANNPPDMSYSGSIPTEIQETHQGPFFKLAGTELRCQAAMDIIQASKALCNEWSARKPGDYTAIETCPLADQPLRGAGKSMSDLFSVDTNFCQTYFTSRFEPISEAEKNRLDAVMSDLMKVDLFMETAYRPAFLVAVTEIDDPEFGRPERQKMMGLRSDGRETVAATDHIVDYLIYHVPATLTDTDLGPDFKNNPAPYSDVIKQTAKLITPQEDIDDFNEKVEDYRAQVKTVVDARQGTRIRCAEPECQNEPLRNALITYLNAVLSANLNFKYLDDRPSSFDMSCEGEDESDPDTRRESGSQIGSALQQQDEFSDIEDAKDYIGMGLGSTSTDTIDVDFQLQQYFERNSSIRNPRADEPKTYLFNISPHRANADFVAQRLDALFTEAQQSENFDQDEGYYDKFEAMLGSAFTVTEHTRQYSEIIPAPFPSVPPQIITQDVPATILEQHEEPQSLRFEWLAKIFNRSTRAITQLIFEEGTAMLDCARDNNNPEHNTEEFLRKCQNQAAGAPIGSAPPAGSICSIEGGFPIESNMIKNLIAESGRKYNVPVEVMMAVLWTENCRSQTQYPPNSGIAATVCEKPDAFLESLNNVYPHTAGCPGSTRPEGTGIFQFNLGYWRAFQESPSSNACAIRDPFFDAARWLNANYSSFGVPSTIGQAPVASSWTPEDMKRSVTRWAANTATCDGHPFAQLYCCVIDQLTVGSNSCSEGWINQLTPIQTTCN